MISDKVMVIIQWYQLDTFPTLATYLQESMLKFLRVIFFVFAYFFWAASSCFAQCTIEFEKALKIISTFKTTITALDTLKMAVNRGFCLGRMHDSIYVTKYHDSLQIQLVVFDGEDDSIEEKARTTKRIALSDTLCDLEQLIVDEEYRILDSNKTNPRIKIEYRGQHLEIKSGGLLDGMYLISHYGIMLFTLFTPEELYIFSAPAPIDTNLLPDEPPLFDLDLGF